MSFEGLRPTETEFRLSTDNRESEEKEVDQNRAKQLESLNKDDSRGIYEFLTQLDEEEFSKIDSDLNIAGLTFRDLSYSEDPERTLEILQELVQSDSDEDRDRFSKELQQLIG